MVEETHPQDLTVKGELVERVYGLYRDKRYVVNRRYQRKLIWGLEEKVRFIDSIIKGYPVPIILLAEDRKREGSLYEIIDGMQRLNAVMSFLENDYMVDDSYFDLNTIAVTKLLLDSDVLVQKTPVMDRQTCVRIASYLLPLSIYEFSDPAGVDDVFRRINSGGRKLSRQELRAAGATGQLAQVVRKIAAKVRGDDSHSDILLLNDMKRISITNKDLDYGLAADQIFWVKNGILTKDQVRESRDEELIADIVAFMISDSPPSSRSEFLDDFFGMGEDDAAIERYNEIELAVQRRTADLIILDFQRTLDELTRTLDKAGKTFGELIFKARPARAPRYFQAVFLAFYELVVKSGRTVRSRSKLIASMSDSKDKIAVPEGGAWGADDRRNVVNSVVGMYQPFFMKAAVNDPANAHWISQLENLLVQSYTEQSAYDFKQGFLNLKDGKTFDEGSFEKILKTCAGMANIQRGYKGYVLVGICEDKVTRERVEKLFATRARAFENFFITGVDHEIKALKKTHDTFFQWIIDKVRASALSEPLKTVVASRVKSVRYFDATIYLFETEGQENPSSYGDKYYIRSGAQLTEVKPAELAQFIRRYILSQGP